MKQKRYYKTTLPEEQLQKLLGAENQYSILTTREREVVQLTSLGFTNIQIAEQFKISTKTVENYKTNIMHKLNLTERYELVQYVLNNDLFRRSLSVSIQLKAFFK